MLSEVGNLKFRLKSLDKLSKELKITKEFVLKNYGTLSNTNSKNSLEEISEDKNEFSRSNRFINTKNNEKNTKELEELFHKKIMNKINSSSKVIKTKILEEILFFIQNIPLFQK